MNLSIIAGLFLAIIVTLVLAVLMARSWAFQLKDVTTNGATDKLLEDGRATLIAEAAFTGSRYLLAAKGTASGSIILCTATLIPLGSCSDEPAIGDYGTVDLFGAGRGTKFVIASKAIAENTNVYATAGGKVTDAVVSNAYWVGKTAPYCSAAADGDKVAIIPRFPTINP